MIVSSSDDTHTAVCWWIPVEFWKASLSRDITISEEERCAFLRVLNDFSLLSIAQFDMIDKYDYYSKSEIESNIVITVIDKNGNENRLFTMQNINSDFDKIIGMLQLVTGDVLGNFGNNAHFYVLNDKSKRDDRLLNPYNKGELRIQFGRRNGEIFEGIIKTPINALFVPRICPNGEKAHISWKFCPWSGKPLEE